MRLVALSGCALLHVSTISVLGDGDDEGEGDESNPGSARLVSEKEGYASSKWVAEERVRRAFAAGIVKAACIVRPGLIGFDGATGSANLSDW